MSYGSHTNNVMVVGFQCDGKWMYSVSENGTINIWDLRSVKVNFIALLDGTRSSSFKTYKYWSSYLILAFGC